MKQFRELRCYDTWLQQINTLETVGNSCFQNDLAAFNASQSVILDQLFRMYLTK